MSDESDVKKGLHGMLVPAAALFERAVDDWCPGCCKPSRMRGNIVQICMCGVGPWGTVEGCAECNLWVYTNNKGEVIDVETIS